jgi:hypothetical protein
VLGKFKESAAALAKASAFSESSKPFKPIIIPALRKKGDDG